MDKESLSAYFSALGKMGGKARWKGKSIEERRAHARKMVKSRVAISLIDKKSKSTPDEL